MEEPENYGKETAEQLRGDFDAYRSEVTETKPDVILVQVESWFDIQRVPGITLERNINENFREYCTVDLISPRYGGYTSAVEFEALTGMSLAFLPDEITPYTTYFNNAQDEFPSVVREFEKSGYYTKVIHPDLPAFYNRDVVYESMGFDEYQAISSFADVPDSEKTENGWVKDSYLAEYTIKELEESEDPQFIFLMTMEEHYVSVEKYADIEIKVEADISADERYAVEQQVQSYYNTAKLVERLIKYADSTDRPTLLYFYGDHLPPVSYLSSSGYLDDIENKYSTMLCVYSNYEELTLEESITPNQLAARMLRDAEVEHSSYFDYIYFLGESYPVIHKEFVDASGEDFDLYRFIQYDMMFGERYLIEGGDGE